MKKHYTLKAAAMAGVCLIPLAQAAAEDADSDANYRNSVDVGIRGQSAKSPVFGRYTGDTKAGADFLGGFSSTGGDAWNSDGTYRWGITGKGIDYTSSRFAPEGSLNAKVGRQGTWTVNLFYDAITYTGEQFYSAFTPAANGTLGVMPAFTPFGGSSPTAAGKIASFAGPGTTAAAGTYITPTPSMFGLQQAGTRRDIYGGDAKYILGPWTFSTTLKEEHKSGSVLETMDQSTSGLAFGMPVDYDTTRFSAQAAYNARQMQASLAYTFSDFHDALTALFAPYLTNKTFAQSGGATLYQVSSAYQTPPSNQAHYLTGSLGLDVNDYTRAMANVRMGVEMQSAATGTGLGEALTPGTGPANILAGNAANASLAARVYGGNFTVTSFPINHLDLRASYSIDARAANWNNSIAGSAGQSDGTPAAGNAFSYGQSWTKQQLALEAGYRVLPSTKVTLGYALDLTDRSVSYVSHSNTNTISAKVTTTPVKNLTGSVTYEYATRSGGTQFTFLAVPTATAGASVSNQLVQWNSALSFVGVPWYQAAMDSNTLKLRTDYRLSESVDLGVIGKLTEHDYHYQPGVIGQARDYTGEVGPDLSFTPSKSVTTHLFYSYEEIYHGDRGASPAYDINNQYGTSASNTDKIHTVGMSGDWKVNDKLKFNLNYTFYYGDLNYVLFDGLTTANSGLTASQFANIQQFPSVSSSMHSLKLNAAYEMASNMELMAGYSYDMFKDNDWAYSTFPAAEPSTLNGGVAVTSGETAPSYHVHSFMTAVKFKF